jgi:membrane-associated phospholipid phosphatase
MLDSSIISYASPDTDARDRRLFWSAAIYAISTSVYFMIVYNGCNWIASKRLHVGTLFFQWERHIPFVPAAIFPYMSIDLFFFFSPWLCRSPAELKAHARRLFLAITLSAGCFLLFPLTMGMTHPNVAGISGKLFSLLAGFDKPFNLVPSLHIAILCILWVIYSRHTRGILRLAIQTWFVLIVISTLLTYQHHLVDLVGGYILGVLCFYLIPDHPSAGGSIRTAFFSRERINRVRNLRVARNYLCGGLLLILLGCLTYPWGFILVWPGIAGVVVALAYFKVGTPIFRKRGGKLPHSSRLILGPYFLVAWIVRRRYRRACEPFCQIAPGIWVGGKLSPAQARELIGNGIGAVLDMTAECSETPDLLQLQYLNLPLLDLTPPTADEIHAGVEFIRAHRQAGVYVHCAIGYSRSVCMVVAYLLASSTTGNFDQAFETVRARRPVALLDHRFRAAIEAYGAGGVRL